MESDGMEVSASACIFACYCLQALIDGPVVQKWYKAHSLAASAAVEQRTAAALLWEAASRQKTLLLGARLVCKHTANYDWQQLNTDLIARTAIQPEGATLLRTDTDVRSSRPDRASPSKDQQVQQHTLKHSSQPKAPLNNVINPCAAALSLQVSSALQGQHGCTANPDRVCCQHVSPHVVGLQREVSSKTTVQHNALVEASRSTSESSRHATHVDMAVSAPIAVTASPHAYDAAVVCQGSAPAAMSASPDINGAAVMSQEPQVPDELLQDTSVPEVAVATKVVMAGHIPTAAQVKHCTAVGAGSVHCPMYTEVHVSTG